LKESLRLNEDRQDYRAWVFLAMSYHQLHETQEVRKLLTRIRSLELPADETWARLELEVLTKEVEALAESK